MVQRRIIPASAGAAVLAGLAIASAAPAAADEDQYLRLRDVYPSYSAEQLLAEGHRVCAVARQGVPSPQAVIMVTNDLGVSTTAALDIVSSAVMNLDC